MQLVQQCDCSCVSLSQTMQNADYVYSLFVLLVKWGLTITQGRSALLSKVSPPLFLTPCWAPLGPFGRLTLLQSDMQLAYV